jgi:hypothetical protein
MADDNPGENTVLPNMKFRLLAYYAARGKAKHGTISLKSKTIEGAGKEALALTLENGKYAFFRLMGYEAHGLSHMFRALGRICGYRNSGRHEVTSDDYHIGDIFAGPVLKEASLVKPKSENDFYPIDADWLKEKYPTEKPNGIMFYARSRQGHFTAMTPGHLLLDRDGKVVAVIMESGEPQFIAPPSPKNSSERQIWAKAHYYHNDLERHDEIRLEAKSFDEALVEAVDRLLQYEPYTHFFLTTRHQLEGLDHVVRGNNKGPFYIGEMYVGLKTKESQDEQGRPILAPVDTYRRAMERSSADRLAKVIFYSRARGGRFVEMVPGALLFNAEGRKTAEINLSGEPLLFEPIGRHGPTVRKERESFIDLAAGS